MALPAGGRGSSLNRNQDLVIHVNARDPDHSASLPSLRTKYAETILLGDYLMLTHA